VVGDLPLFMQDEKIANSLEETVNCVPKGCEVFIFGGTTRNAVFYSLFKEKHPQRDYDLIYLGNEREQFSQCLRKEKDFEFGKIRRDNQTVFRQALEEEPELYSGYIYLDVHYAQQKEILAALKHTCNFTISSFALNLNQINSPDWQEQLVHLPQAWKDMKNKQLRLNPFIQEIPSTTLFTCLRFMSLGYKPPGEEEVERMVSALSTIPSREKFERNVDKVVDYVGGEEKARQLADQLGIERDIFDFETVKGPD